MNTKFRLSTTFGSYSLSEMSYVVPLMDLMELDIQLDKDVYLKANF